MERLPTKTSRSTRSVNHQLDGIELKESIVAVCSELLASWKDIRSSDIKVVTISGGISNALYKVELVKEDIEMKHPERRIVLRVYGENTEKFVDREEEVAIMDELHENGFGPCVLGTFANGRIESYLELVCLHPDDISRSVFAESIAKTLGKFHCVSSSWKAPERAMTPFQRTREWLLTSKQLDFSDSLKDRDLYNSLHVDRILEEVDAVEKASRALDSPIVFCHNDLLSGNIMVDQENGQIRHMTFIDFEYADWAPRGFDLGNHFCEYAGFEGDYSKYPTDPTLFIKEYLRVFEGDEPSQSRIAHVVDEANLFALAAHLYWVAWSILQAKWSKIDFDYMEYAKVRLDEYYKRKDDFLKCV